MDNIIKMSNSKSEQSDICPIPDENESILIQVADGILFDVRNDMSKINKITMPIAQLSTLGAGVASLLPSFRTVTQTTSVSGEGLYRLSNAAIGDALKATKNGDFWGALKTSAGKSKMARFQKVENYTSTSQAVMPISPATMMMSVALFSIEQQLGKIEEMQKSILSFLEIEKESEIEADVETLSNIIKMYKHNWDNEHFVNSNHQTVNDIQRTARKNMLSYQKKVKDIIKARQIVSLQSKVKNTLDELMKNFKYYRLSLFAFSMSSLIEIMLSGNFKEENILSIKNEIENYSFTYRDIFGDCSAYLENMEKVALETNILKGIGATSKAVGKFIGNIPVVKEGKVDEFLQDSGEKVKDKAKSVERGTVESFAEISNPGTNLFTEKMNDLVLIYNHTTDICFDNDNVYIIAG